MQSARAVVSLSTFTRESGTWPRDCRLRSAALLEQNSIGSDTTRPKQYTDVRRDSGNTSGMQNICPRTPAPLALHRHPSTRALTMTTKSPRAARVVSTHQALQAGLSSASLEQHLPIYYYYYYCIRLTVSFPGQLV